MDAFSSLINLQPAPAGECGNTADDGTQCGQATADDGPLCEYHLSVIREKLAEVH
ncbi:hypothetical protein Q5752_005525 [Cryptotrichosporon argae]